MGFNSIRIYFHWGYHSPDEGVYNFDGNRDVEYLLSLCEELGLFVLAAPGPYICAETQAGGYPGWLIAKRHLRIRHNQFMLWRTYDEEFAQYEVQWLNQILPIIAKHQITENDVTKKKGCVIGVQIDNELFERMAAILPIGLRDQMRVLAKAARDAGITVPLFSNDGFEESSWVPHPELESREGFWASSSFGLDWYGFDKYVVFAPTSNPTSWLLNTGNSINQRNEWSTKQVSNSMDRLEKTVRLFGGGARQSPLFIPELQGGWFNHYQLEHTYDAINDFYGPSYTKTIIDSALAQGVSMLNLYMVYGGTNWGSLGDPDVYTSYDYSASIREYGYMSNRGRNVRESLLFARSFDPYFTRTARVPKRTIKPSLKRTISTQRSSVGADQDVLFTFFRNFNDKGVDLFDVAVQMPEGNFTLQCFLPYRASFTAVGNYEAVNGVRLLQSTIPIHLRMVNKESNEEVWIIEPNQFGGLALEHKEVDITGNMQDDILRRDGPAAILKFEKMDGWTKLRTPSGELTLIGLTREKVSTLYAYFQDPYWNEGRNHSPAFIAWGADTIVYNSKTRSLETNYRNSDLDLHIVSFSRPADHRLVPVNRGVYHTSNIYGVELRHQQLSILPVNIVLHDWQERSANFDSFPWHHLRRLSEEGSLTFDALDYHYLSGHVLYRTTFAMPAGRVVLTLNARNRATVLVNGQVVGGHTTYSRQLFSAGAKIGPDPWFLGSRTYDITSHLHGDGPNELVILVDSFGLCRQAFIMNDVRNPRGIIKVKLSGLTEEPIWEMTGTDVRRLDNPYNSTGFPDERAVDGWTSMVAKVQREQTTYSFWLDRSQGVKHIQFKFNGLSKPFSPSMNVPLRLRLDGPFTAFVFLNDVLIARYYGNGDSPQHDFYLPDGLIQYRDNTVRMLVYTWEDGDAHVHIAGWPVDPETGNMITKHDSANPPREYMIWKDHFKM
ncbi:glycoside hydrolase superfamily [Dichotomocladium elegans]|nr:glycoside hydrolase superfamily [Dichotomocladium elegans]